MRATKCQKWQNYEIWTVSNPVGFVLSIFIAFYNFLYVTSLHLKGYLCILQLLAIENILYFLRNLHWHGVFTKDYKWQNVCCDAIMPTPHLHTFTLTVSMLQYNCNRIGFVLQIGSSYEEDALGIFTNLYLDMDLNHIYVFIALVEVLPYLYQGHPFYFLYLWILSSKFQL